MYINRDLYDRPHLEMVLGVSDPDKYLTERVGKLKKWINDNQDLLKDEKELVDELLELESKRETILMLDLFATLARLLIERKNTRNI